MIIPSPIIAFNAIGMGFAFIIYLLVRLPNFNRPVSKHYEFNTAVILINIISWRQAGGGNHFYYTPVMNFQHTGDKLPPTIYMLTGTEQCISFFWARLVYNTLFRISFLGLPAEPVYLKY